MELHLPPRLQHGRQRQQDLHEGRNLERPHACLQTWVPKNPFASDSNLNFNNIFSRWLRSPRHDRERPSGASQFDDHYLSPVEYHCIPQYKLVGQYLHNCKEDAIWSGDEPTCERNNRLIFIWDLRIYWILLQRLLLLTAQRPSKWDSSSAYALEFCCSCYCFWAFATCACEYIILVCQLKR